MNDLIPANIQKDIQEIARKINPNSMEVYKTPIEKRLINSKFYQALIKLDDKELKLVAGIIGLAPAALDCVRMYLQTAGWSNDIQNLAIRVELERRGLINNENPP